MALLLAAPVVAPAMPFASTQPIAPFRLIGPIDYVGSDGLAAYLIHTDAGAILIDGTLAANAALVARNVAAMGVPIGQVKLILVTHAHYDHAGAIAALAARSGAKVVAGAGDRAALESGRPPCEASSAPVPFPAVHVDRAVRDGDVVRLGGVALVARATPGHTPGCTSWTTRVRDRGRSLAIIFPCSVTVAGNRLAGDHAYPGIVRDYRRSLAMLAALPADVVLPSHPEVADVLSRHANGTLVDPGLLARIVAGARAAFDDELASQRSETAGA